MRSSPLLARPCSVACHTTPHDPPPPPPLAIKQPGWVFRPSKPGRGWVALGPMLGNRVAGVACGVASWAGVYSKALSSSDRPGFRWPARDPARSWRRGEARRPGLYLSRQRQRGGAMERASPARPPAPRTGHPRLPPHNRRPTGRPAVSPQQQAAERGSRPGRRQAGAVSSPAQSSPGQPSPRACLSISPAFVRWRKEEGPNARPCPALPSPACHEPRSWRR